jgi:hypothetical protein
MSVVTTSVGFAPAPRMSVQAVKFQNFKSLTQKRKDLNSVQSPSNLQWTSAMPQKNKWKLGNTTSNFNQSDATESRSHAQQNAGGACRSRGSQSHSTSADKSATESAGTVAASRSVAWLSPGWGVSVTCQEPCHPISEKNQFDLVRHRCGHKSLRHFLCGNGATNKCVKDQVDNGICGPEMTWNLVWGVSTGFGKRRRVADVKHLGSFAQFFPPVTE